MLHSGSLLRLGQSALVLGSLSSLAAAASHREPVSMNEEEAPKFFNMIAMDMDGTLLNEQHEISDETLETLRRLSAKGVIVALATGRSGPAVYRHVRKLNLPRPLPVVCYNGASCRLFPPHPVDPASEQKILFESPLSPSAVEDVLTLSKELGCLVQYYVGDSIFVVSKSASDADFIRRYHGLTGATHTFLNTYDNILTEKGPPSKILLMTDDPDRVVEAARAFQKKSTVPSFNVIRGNPPFFVEFLDANTCKGNGLEHLCRLMNLPTGGVVAFGDGDNDIEFLQISGLGIAMKNARQIVKDCADRVSERKHSENGVAYELLKLEMSRNLVPAPKAEAAGLYK